MSERAIRMAVAGIGGRGTWGAKEFARLDDFELVAVVDELLPRAELIVSEEKLDGVAIFASIDECLAKVDVDAVAVFTPDGRHAEVVLPALKAGKHVFVDKPLEVTAAKLDAIIAADNAAGGKTFVGFNLRYAPVYSRIRQLIADGVAGQVLTIQADEFYDGGRTYFRRWNRWREVGGGLWITKASHDFDLLYWMADAAPQQVYASTSLDYYVPRDDAAMYCRDCQYVKDCPDRYEIWAPQDAFNRRLHDLTETLTGRKADLCLFNAEKDTFDHGIALVTFANHVQATYTVNVVAGFTNRRMRVAGTKATIDGDLHDSSIIIRHRDPDTEELIDVSGGEGGHGGSDELILASFADFVRGNPTNFVAPTEAAVAVRIGLAATQSADERQAIDMPA